MATIDSDRDFFVHYYKGKVVTILCYSSRAYVAAEKLRSSGIDVVIGMRDNSGFDDWGHRGFQTYSIWEATQRGEIIQVW